MNRVVELRNPVIEGETDRSRFATRELMLVRSKGTPFRLGLGEFKSDGVPAFTPCVTKPEARELIRKGQGIASVRTI